MKYFTREASQQQSHWKGRSRWNSLWERYAQELARTRDQLTPGWRQLADLDLHDYGVAAVDCPSASEVILRFDPCSEVSALRFLGVRDARIPESVVGDIWSWAEVHLTPDGCGDLQVLLRDSEMQILAFDVGVFTSHDDTA
jgi:hypothetical protein